MKPGRSPRNTLFWTAIAIAVAIPSAILVTRSGVFEADRGEPPRRFVPRGVQDSVDAAGRDISADMAETRARAEERTKEIVTEQRQRLDEISDNLEAAVGDSSED